MVPVGGRGPGSSLGSESCSDSSGASTYAPSLVESLDSVDETAGECLYSSTGDSAGASVTYWDGSVAHYSCSVS